MAVELEVCSYVTTLSAECVPASPICFPSFLVIPGLVLLPLSLCGRTLSSQGGSTERRENLCRLSRDLRNSFVTKWRIRFVSLGHSWVLDEQETTIFKDGKRVSHHNDRTLKNSKSFFGINFAMGLSHESNKESLRRLKVLLKKLVLFAFFLTIFVSVMTQKFNVSKYKMSNGQCPPFYHEEFGGNCNRRTF